MAFVVAHRITGVSGRPRRSWLRTGQLLANRLCRWRPPTSQERVDRYVSQMPIAVITASLGGHPSGAADSRR